MLCVVFFVTASFSQTMFLSSMFPYFMFLHGLYSFQWDVQAATFSNMVFQRTVNGWLGAYLYLFVNVNVVIACPLNWWRCEYSDSRMFPQFGLQAAKYPNYPNNQHGSCDGTSHFELSWVVLCWIVNFRILAIMTRLNDRDILIIASLFFLFSQCWMRFSVNMFVPIWVVIW